MQIATLILIIYSLAIQLIEYRLCCFNDFCADAYKQMT